MKDKKKSYRDLIVWQKADGLFHMVADDVSSWPKTKVAKAISYQVLDSAGSVSMNIAEGYGRGGSKKFRQYFRQSRGSLVETDNWSYKLSRLEKPRFLCSSLQLREQKTRHLASLLSRRASL